MSEGQMTSEEYRTYLKTKKLPERFGTKKKKPKYNNSPKIYNGIKYHSTGEADFAKQLDWRKKQGEIKKWEPQWPFPLESNGESLGNYLIDFKVEYSDGRIELIEYKGFETALWKFKWKMANATIDKVLPGAKLVLVKHK